MRGPRDGPAQTYLQFFIPGFISCGSVHKGRCAMWRMSNTEAVIFMGWNAGAWHGVR
jgi:hypothetical protein